MNALALEPARGSCVHVLTFAYFDLDQVTWVSFVPPTSSELSLPQVTFWRRNWINEFPADIAMNNQLHTASFTSVLSLRRNVFHCNKVQEVLVVIFISRSLWQLGQIVNLIDLRAAEQNVKAHIWVCLVSYGDLTLGTPSGPWCFMFCSAFGHHEIITVLFTVPLYQDVSMLSANHGLNLLKCKADEHIHL